MMHIRSFSGLAMAPVIALSVLTACSDPTEPDEHAEEIAAIRLTIGTQQVTITEGGAQGGASIPIGNTTVTAIFLADDGDVVELHDDEFEIRLNSTNAARLTFARTGAFAGTLTGITSGSAIVEVRLWHLEEDHADFGPHNLTITVQ